MVASSPGRLSEGWDVKVVLSKEQMDRVRRVVAKQKAHYRGKPNGHGAKANAISHEDEVGGFAGELAVATALGAAWHAETTLDTSGPDVGRATQVRTLTRPTSKRLLVRPHDLRKYGDVPYVLVRRDGDREFTLLGWIYGDDVPVRGRKTDGGDPSRPPMYLVDPDDLEPMAGLKVA